MAMVHGTTAQRSTSTKLLQALATTSPNQVGEGEDIIELKSRVSRVCYPLVENTNGRIYPLVGRIMFNEFQKNSECTANRVQTIYTATHQTFP